MDFRRVLFRSEAEDGIRSWSVTRVQTCALPIRSEEHTSELQSLRHLVCRLLLEKKKDANVPFTIKVVESDEINAFALPGGCFYVNRWLILPADYESEVAEVMR